LFQQLSQNPTKASKIVGAKIMSDEVILRIEDRENIRILTLNRPNKLNAMNEVLVHALVSAIDDAHADDSISAIIMAGSERAFSAGADITEAASRENDGGGSSPRREIAGNIPTWRPHGQTDDRCRAGICSRRRV
jgi:enoyl-CoA hydratase/carnithine racemase